MTAPAQAPCATGNSLGALAKGFGALLEKTGHSTVFKGTAVKTMISLRGFGKDRQDEGRTEQPPLNAQCRNCSGAFAFLVYLVFCHRYGEHQR